jgi:hypothetical protein
LPYRPRARAQKSPAAKKITINGKLTRATGIGGGGTGWALELKREITLEVRKLNSIEVSGAQEEFESGKSNELRRMGRWCITTASSEAIIWCSK